LKYHCWRRLCFTTWEPPTYETARLWNNGISSKSSLVEMESTLLLSWNTKSVLSSHPTTARRFRRPQITHVGFDSLLRSYTPIIYSLLYPTILLTNPRLTLDDTDLPSLKRHSPLTRARSYTSPLFSRLQLIVTLIPLLIVILHLYYHPRLTILTRIRALCLYIPTSIVLWIGSATGSRSRFRIILRKDREGFTNLLRSHEYSSHLPDLLEVILLKHNLGKESY
jgi:hypothetical protein